MKRDDKFEIKYLETKDHKQKYSEIWESIIALDVVDSIDEIDINGKRIVIFRNPDSAEIEIIEAFEGIKIIEQITSFKNVEVR